MKTSTGESLLTGKRILITRMAEQAASLAEPLAALGAEPLLCPMLEIVPPENFSELDAALAELSSFDYLILTSANAVCAFFTRLRRRGLDTKALTNLRIVAVGPKTAEAIAAEGVVADLIPADYRAEGVVNLLRGHVIGKRLLYPKAALARDLIPVALIAAGGEVVDPVAYASAPPADAADKLRQALTDRVDLLTFTASSTVQNFVDLIEADQLTLAKQIPVASIGPLTSETAREHGFKVVAEPANSTLEELVAAIREYFEHL